jgi:hypothetical protein
MLNEARKSFGTSGRSCFFSAWGFHPSSSLPTTSSLNLGKPDLWYKAHLTLSFCSNQNYQPLSPPLSSPSSTNGRLLPGGKAKIFFLFLKCEPHIPYGAHYFDTSTVEFSAYRQNCSTFRIPSPFEINRISGFLSRRLGSFDSWVRSSASCGDLDI